MKRIFLLLIAFMMNIQNVFAMNVDQFMDEKFAPVADKIADFIFTPVTICGNEVSIIIFWILIAGIFFTIYFKGIISLKDKKIFVVNNNFLYIDSKQEEMEKILIKNGFTNLNSCNLEIN